MFLASMRFDLGEDVQALQDAVHRFSQIGRASCRERV